MKKFTAYFIIVFILFSMIDYRLINADTWPTSPSLSGDSGGVIVMDASSGTVLYSKNSDAKKYPASITKIMTAYLAVENCSLDETITFSKSAINNVDYGSSSIGTVSGEKIKLKDALYALMLESANEVANGIAEHVSGSNASFAKLMNKTAKELGCKNTHFVTPSGLHDSNHYTTAYDMALICRAALKNETFRKVVSTKTYSMDPTNKQSGTRYFANHHRMLNGGNNPEYMYDGCIGGKTGYTQAAQNTLATFAKRDSMTLITVVLDSNFQSQYNDTIKMMNYGFKNFTKHSVTKNEGSNIKNDLSLFQRYYPIEKEDSACIFIPEDSSVILPKSVAYSKATKKVEFYENAKLKRGENTIGKITYMYNNKTVGSNNIIMKFYPSSTLPTITLPEEMQDYGLLLKGTGSKFSVTNIKTLIIDTIFVAICLVVFITLFLFIKQMKRNNRRRRAYYSRRRYSKKFWDDFDF